MPASRPSSSAICSKMPGRTSARLFGRPPSPILSGELRSPKSGSKGTRADRGSAPLKWPKSSDRLSDQGIAK